MSLPKNPNDYRVSGIEPLRHASSPAEFAIWSMRVKWHAKTFGVDKWLTGGCRERAQVVVGVDGEEGPEQWDQRSDAALSCIFYNIDISVMPFVQNLTSAKDAWAVLTNKYVSTTEASKQLVMQKMSNLRMLSTESVDDFIARFQQIRNEAALFSLEYPDALLRSIFLQAVRAREPFANVRHSSHSGERDFAQPAGRDGGCQAGRGAACSNSGNADAGGRDKRKSDTG
jgi:gag-polypeptide of LTR copia-type